MGPRIARRIEELDSGKVKAIPWADARRQISHPQWPLSFLRFTLPPWKNLNWHSIGIWNATKLLLSNLLLKWIEQWNC